MSGLFAEYQPRYAAHGLPTFPVGAGKRPAVSGYMRVGVSASAQLALKFAGADAFGLTVGARNRITVLDVDCNDEAVLADALSRYGSTPFIVRSGSGNWQAWYKHDGERRRIRPNPTEPIDILGGGFVIAPPSVTERGQYQLVQGSIDDLDRLPPMRSVSQLTTRCQLAIPAGMAIPTGTRNATLFRRALVHARACDDLDGLLDAVRTENLSCDTPVEDAEVVKIAESAWRYQKAGKNFVGVGGAIVMHNEIDDLAASDPDALALLLILRRRHSQRDQFSLANAMAETLGWRRHRFAATRKRLEDYGAIRCVHRGGRGQNDPSVYSWPGKVYDSVHQYNYTPSPTSSPSSRSQH